MPEFIKRFFRTDKAAREKFLNYDGLRYLVQKLTNSVCEQLLSPINIAEWCAVNLRKSLSGYKYATLVLKVEGQVQRIENIPVQLLRQVTSPDYCIHISAPADFGDLSASVYYVSDTKLMVKTSLASMEIYGTN